MISNTNKHIKQKTRNNLWRTSNAIKKYVVTEEDGLECFNGLGVVIMFGLLIILLIAFGWLLGGL